MKLNPWHIVTLILAVLVALVVLTLTEHDPTSLVGAVVTLLGVLGVGGHLAAKTDEQTEQIDQIKGTVEKVEHQTNGVLAEKIRTEVSAGIAAEVPAAVQQALTDFMAERPVSAENSQPDAEGLVDRPTAAGLDRGELHGPPQRVSR